MKQPIRNIAILAHVDAGKTTLSERILFATGEVHRPGRVEDGLATMDYMPEEKERGITIESGVAHFEWKNTWFNFIDTPGHVDFGAEVDMALAAVEGAVLVVSAASGVETQTVAAFRKLRESGIKAVTEIPTFPYDQEFRTFPLKTRLGLKVDKMFRHRLARELSAIVTFSDAEQIFGQRTIRISNGVDFDSIPCTVTRLPATAASI